MAARNPGSALLLSQHLPGVAPLQQEGCSRAFPALSAQPALSTPVPQLGICSAGCAPKAELRAIAVAGCPHAVVVMLDLPSLDEMCCYLR